MTSRALRAGAAVGLVLTSLGAVARAQPVPPPPALAPSDVEEARKHYARGVELYEQHADASALAELERAYQLAPNWKVLYELGVVELALHDFAASLAYFERYLAEATDGKDGITPARRQEVSERIATLGQEVATIAIIAPAGAALTLDDVAIGAAPIAKPLVVNPGHHKIGAAKDGVTAESRVLSVAGGDHASVALVIAAPAPAVAPPPVAVPEPPPPPPPSPLMIPLGDVPPSSARAAPYPLWAGWLTTGVLAAGAVATGIEALAANKSLTNAKNGGPSTAAALSSLSSRAHGYALASDLLTGGAVIAGGTTLYFMLRPSHPAPTSASVAIGVALDRVTLAAAF